MASPAWVRHLILEPNLSTGCPTICTPSPPPSPSLATHALVQLTTANCQDYCLPSPGLLFRLLTPLGYSLHDSQSALFQNIHQRILFPCFHLLMVSHSLRVNSEFFIVVFKVPHDLASTASLMSSAASLFPGLNTQTTHLPSDHPTDHTLSCLLCQVLHCLDCLSSRYLSGLLLLVI